MFCIERWDICNNLVAKKTVFIREAKISMYYVDVDILVNRISI